MILLRRDHEMMLRPIEAFMYRLDRQLALDDIWSIILCKE